MALAPFVLLLALAPSALYIDHWVDMFSPPGPSVVEVTPHSKPDSHHHGDQTTHNMHCHGSGGCSGSYLPIVFGDAVLEAKMAGTDLPAVLLSESGSTLEEFLAPPLTEPPRF
jgi:hypothetical protein